MALHFFHLDINLVPACHCTQCKLCANLVWQAVLEFFDKRIPSRGQTYLAVVVEAAAKNHVSRYKRIL